jgi:histidyl-tRNA synthetase
VFESYGFEPLETPSLEYAEILTGKYGDEGDKLMYKFKDNGGRDVALRYDQTVPLARVIAEYGEKLPMPFKRYQIQNVWRAENPQRGRFREFLQCDIDTVGTDSINADSEIIICVAKCLEALGFKQFKILINDRKNLKDIPKEAIIIIDKLKKIGEEGVKKELSEKGFDSNILENIKTSGKTPAIDLLVEKLEGKVIFEPTLARGLDYYTGLIFEIEIDGYSAGSVAGGGRYDELVGVFSDKQIPAVGASFGFDRLIEAMDELNLFPKDLITSKVLVLNLPNFEEKALEVADKLRENNINTEVYLDSNIEKGKQFNYAEKKGIPYTIVPNENETLTIGWKNENGQIEKVENLAFDNLLEHLRS